MGIDEGMRAATKLTIALVAVIGLWLTAIGTIYPTALSASKLVRTGTSTQLVSSAYGDADIMITGGSEATVTPMATEARRGRSTAVSAGRAYASL